jgi:hypothetical protein
MSSGRPGRMLRLSTIVVSCAAVVAGLICLIFGGPAEAYAVARIDGFQIVPLPFVSTCYPPGFTHAKYRQVANGDTPDAVRARLGDPLTILWSLDDEFMGQFVWFEPVDGQWRSTYAHEMGVPNGTPMSALAALRAGVVGEVWRYSRSCERDSSLRLRWIAFSHGRMNGRGWGIYYD